MWIPNLANDEIYAGTLNLADSDFYLHLLKSEPLQSVATVSQLDRPTGAGYTRTLVPTTYASNQLRAASDVLITPFAGLETITHWALCKGSGVNTDRVCLVTALYNIDFSIMPSIESGDPGIQVLLTQNSFLIERAPGDTIFSAATVIQPLPSVSLGTFNQVRTNNGTAVSPPANAVGAAATNKILTLNGTIAPNNSAANITDRSAGSTIVFSANGACFDWDFEGGATNQIIKRIRPGILILRYSVSSPGAGKELQIRASQFLQSWTAANVQDDAQHEVIYTWSIPNAVATNQEIQLPINSPTFWRYLGFKFVRPSGTAQLTIHEAEFSGLDSKVSSNTGQL